MKCKYCRSTDLIRFGIRNNIQRYRCKSCKKLFLESYKYAGSKPSTNDKVKRLTKEGLGIRNISRFLEISTTTVLKKIKQVASEITKPNTFKKNQYYQVDEMRTFIKNKDEGVIWIFYALSKETKEVIDCVIGRRTSENARRLTENLLKFSPKRINTDKLNIYPNLIPDKIHKTNKHGTNHIERKNLTLRTNLKRLNRKSICYSRSKEMLMACLTIFFWG